MSEIANNQNRIAIVGGGPAGLSAAEALAGRGHSVTIYERMPTLGRKFLLAGRGGLNLTHSEEQAAFMRRYGRAAARVQPAIDQWTPDQLIAWARDLGQETFVGSSGRVFPKAMKASPLLRAWLARLSALGVETKSRHRWVGLDGTDMLFETPAGQISVEADAVILATGGASWPRLGSDGAFAGILQHAGVPVTPLEPANCGFTVTWSEGFAARHAGTPLKRIALTADGVRVTGEAMISARGIEGGAVYQLSKTIRREIGRKGKARLMLDLRPDMTAKELVARVGHGSAKDSLSNRLRKTLKLPPAAIGLLRESAGKDLPADPEALAALIKSAPIELLAPFPIDRAISTAGGVAFDGVDEHLMLKKLPGVFVAGEMLDWEAPTGGYLLQACFSTGRAAAAGVENWLRMGKTVTAAKVRATT